MTNADPGDRKTMDTTQTGTLSNASEIERLDREWQVRRDNLLSQQRDGSRREPRSTGGLLVIIIGGGFFLLGTVAYYVSARWAETYLGGLGSGAAEHAASPMNGIGGCFIVCGIMGFLTSIMIGIGLMQNARFYRRELASYQLKRSQLIRESATAAQEKTDKMCPPAAPDSPPVPDWHTRPHEG
jgi:hypothetical protein